MVSHVDNSRKYPDLYKMFINMWITCGLRIAQDPLLFPLTEIKPYATIPAPLEIAGPDYA